MADNTIKLIRDAEKALNKLRNKLRRADLNYTVQVSVNSTDPTVVTYAAQMTPPAEGLAPVTYIASTGEELVSKIKESIKHIDYNEVEKAYHNSQVEACERTIAMHKERLEKLNNPEVENPAPNGAEVLAEAEVTPSEDVEQNNPPTEGDTNDQDKS